MAILLVVVLSTASSDGISTGRDVATGSATAILADGLVDAKYALKAQYRNGLLGAVRWLFHRDAVKMISKLKSNDNQYIWLSTSGSLDCNSISLTFC